MYPMITYIDFDTLLSVDTVGQAAIYTVLSFLFGWNDTTY